MSASDHTWVGACKAGERGTLLSVWGTLVLTPSLVRGLSFHLLFSFSSYHQGMLSMGFSVCRGVHPAVPSLPGVLQAGDSCCWLGSLVMLVCSWQQKHSDETQPLMGVQENTVTTCVLTS